MYLNEVSQHALVEVVSIPDMTTRQSLRAMGITEGTPLRCLMRLNRGPVVVRTGGATLALGQELAGQIQVAAASIQSGG